MLTELRTRPLNCSPCYTFGNLLRPLSVYPELRRAAGSSPRPRPLSLLSPPISPPGDFPKTHVFSFLVSASDSRALFAKNGTHLPFLLLRPPQAAILGLRPGRQAGPRSSSRRARPRTQLGLGRPGTLRTLSRLRARFARPRQQRLGAGSHLQRRRACPRPLRAPRHHRRLSAPPDRPFARRRHRPALRRRISRPRAKGRLH